MDYSRCVLFLLDLVMTEASEGSDLHKRNKTYRPFALSKFGTIFLWLPCLRRRWLVGACASPFYAVVSG